MKLHPSLRRELILPPCLPIPLGFTSLITFFLCIFNAWGVWAFRPCGLMKLYPECFISTCQCEALRQASAECQTSAPLNSANKHCSCFGGGHHIRKIPGCLSFLVLPPSRFQGPAPRGAGKGNRAMGSQSWAASLPDRAGARTVANPVSSLLPSGCLPGVRHSHQCLSLDQPQRRFSERCISLGHTCDHAC